MTVSNTLLLQYLGDTKQLRAEIEAGSASLNNFFKANKSVGDSLKGLKDRLSATSATTALLVGGTVVAAAAITKIVASAAEYGNELQRMSNRTGETVESLSRLKFAAEQEDVSLGEVAGSLRIVSRQADAAARGNDKASAAFSRLGVDVKDANGNLKSGNQLLREIGAGLAKIPPGTARTAAGMAVLGRSAQSIIPLVTNLDALDKRAEHLGLTVRGRFGRDADEFGDRIDELRAIFQRTGVSIASVFLPSINSLLAAFTDDSGAIDAIKDFNDFLERTGFHVFRATNTILALNASLEILAEMVRRKLGFAGTDAAIERFREQLDKAAKQATITREEFEKLQETQAKGAEAPQSSTEALAALVQGLTATETAIEPVVGLAEKLAGTFPDLNPRFQELVSGLRDIAGTGPEAAKALESVLAVAAKAREDLSSELAESFRSLTEGAGRPERSARRREPGVQGPLTQEQVAGIGEPLAASDTEQLQKAPKLLEDSATFAEKLQAAMTASDLAAADLNTTLAEGQGLVAGLSQLADGFSDALISAAEGGKLAFQDFFKSLLKDLAKAIVRATILQAILSVFGGGFSLAKIGRNVQQALGFGALGFAHQESSILGRASQARSLDALSGPSFAGGGVENVMLSRNEKSVNVYEPGPFTVVEMTDRGVLPRIRTRRRRLNEEAL